MSDLTEWREELAGVLELILFDALSETSLDDDLAHACAKGRRFGTADALLASPAMARLLAEVRAEALRVVRVVEGDMADQAAAAWRSADARRGLSDHEALIVHADALTRWSERFRMAMNGEDYRDDRTTAHPTDDHAGGGEVSAGRAGWGVSEKSAEDAAPVYRGRLYHPDGSYSPIERWVRAANGDWISLDSERRTSRDILLEPEAGEQDG